MFIIYVFIICEIVLSSKGSNVNWTLSQLKKKVYFWKYRDVNVQKSVFWPLDDGILCLPSGFLYVLVQTLEHQREEKICINARVRQWARREGGASGWSRGRSAVYAPVTTAQWITNAEIIQIPSISHGRSYNLRPLEAPQPTCIWSSVGFARNSDVE